MNATTTRPLVKPVTCRRCKNTGMVPSHVRHLGIPGLCMGCDGRGVKEGDKAELARIKAENDYAMRCQHVEDELWRTAANYKLTRDESTRAWAAHNGLLLLKANEPERYVKAVEAHYAGDPRLAAALAAYYFEHQED